MERLEFTPGSSPRSAMILHAEKREKCLCGKRAQGTLLAPDGSGRRVLPCCFKCGLIVLEFQKRCENDESAAFNGVPGELHDWFVSDSGISSMVIASVLVPSLRSSCIARLDGCANAPQDPDDFGRCYRLLKLIPNGVDRLAEVAAAHPKWTRLVTVWPQLTRLYEDELPSGKAPQLYALLKGLRDG